MDGKGGVTAQRIVTEPPTEAYTGSAFVIVTVCWDGAMRGREGEREREREREREGKKGREMLGTIKVQVTMAITTEVLSFTCH